MKQKIQVYAIVRLDDAQTGEDAVTIKLIVPTLDEAEQEVSRLNQLNDEKGSHYFGKPHGFQLHRLHPNAHRFQQKKNLSVTS